MDVEAGEQIVIVVSGYDADDNGAVLLQTRRSQVVKVLGLLIKLLNSHQVDLAHALDQTHQLIDSPTSHALKVAAAARASAKFATLFA